VTPLLITVGTALVYLASFETLALSQEAETIYSRCLVCMVLFTVTRLAVTLRNSGRLFVRLSEAHARAEAMADELRRGEARFRAIFDRAPIGIQIADMEGYLVDANKAAERMLGYDPGELQGRHWTEVTHPDNVAEEDRLDELLLARDIEQYEIEERQIRKDGSLIWTQQTVTEVWDQDGQAQFGIALVEDVTEHKAMIQELQEREASFRLLFADNPHPMWVYDIATLSFCEVNDTAVRLYGYSREEFLAMRITDIRPAQWIPDMMRGVAMHRVQSSTCSHTQHRLKDGSVIDVEVATHSLHFAGRDAVLVLAQNITERKNFENQLKHQALHDPLTGLPNRTLLNDRLEQVILAARRNATSLALLLMDLDGFKDVNDTFGHHHGDLLLEQVGLRLCRVLQASDTVARLGGDEFAIILPATDEVGSTQAVRRIIASFKEQFVVESRSLHVDASVGIALYPSHGDDASTLLRRADVAMYVAKRAGDDRRYAVYTAEQDLHTPEKLALIGELRQAIEEEHLFLQYQPKVDLRTGATSHVEALVRWRHARRGMIPPDQFVCLAEETGMIKSLTLCVLGQALQQCQRWGRAGFNISVAVNLSARNLRDPQLPSLVMDLLQHHDVPATSLGIEITESTLMGDPAQAMLVLTELHDMGVRIAIDDFGTGYSSLAYLRRLPVDEIKIDRSFVMEMASDENDATIVQSVIDLGHNLDLQVVAEGVENQASLEMLATCGCDQVQGYYLARPMAAADLEGWLALDRVAATA